MIEVVLQADRRGPEAVARQRRFVKNSVAQPLGVADEAKNQTSGA